MIELHHIPEIIKLNTHRDASKLAPPTLQKYKLLAHRPQTCSPCIDHFNSMVQTGHFIRY